MGLAVGGVQVWQKGPLGDESRSGSPVLLQPLEVKSPKVPVRELEALSPQ